jgi:hypothetical protein
LKPLPAAGLQAHLVFLVKGNPSATSRGPLSASQREGVGGAPRPTGGCAGRGGYGQGNSRLRAASRSLLCVQRHISSRTADSGTPILKPKQRTRAYFNEIISFPCPGLAFPLEIIPHQLYVMCMFACMSAWQVSQTLAVVTTDPDLPHVFVRGHQVYTSS